MNGIDETSSALSLVKQLLQQCDGTGDVTLSKETLKLVLTTFIQQWNGDQERKRQDYKKVAGNA